MLLDIVIFNVLHSGDACIIEPVSVFFNQLHHVVKEGSALTVPWALISTAEKTPPVCMETDLLDLFSNLAGRR